MSDPAAPVPDPIARLTTELVAGLLGARSVVALDVGGRWGAADAWWALSPLARIVGFEPDAEECARVNAALDPESGQRYVPLALGRTNGQAVLHVTEDPACSSLYPPDEAMIERYPELAEMRAVREVPVSLVPLDAWAEREGTPDVAFIKLDTQGSELDILHGGIRVLAGVVGVEVEVQFTPFYRGAPAFADVDRFLREQGFSLWRIESCCHYAESLTGSADREDHVHYGGLDAVHPIGSGRLYWANAIYFRDPLGLGSDDGGRRLLTLAALLAAVGDRAGAAVALRRAAPTLGAERERIERHAAALVAPQPAARSRKRGRLWSKLSRRAQA